MANLLLKLVSSVPATLGHRAVIAVGTSGDYKLYIGDSSNNPVQVTPTITPNTSVTSIVAGDSPYTVSPSAGHDIILADVTNGAITVTLPTAVGIKGQIITVKKLDNTNNVTVDGDGTETIDGSSTYTISEQYMSVTVVSDEANWSIIRPKQSLPTIPTHVDSDAIVAADSPYTATVNGFQNLVTADATNEAITVTLPPLANWANQYITVKKIDSSANAVTIDGDGTETIEGNSSLSLPNQYDHYTIFSDGSQLIIVGS